MKMTNKAIPYGKQYINSDDVNAVVETLNADFLTQGPKILEFEKAFASYIGCEYAVAVSNGTAALHLSALALGVMPGDKVITTPITFAASANCVKYCGGEVVFADINPKTYLLDIDAVRALLEASPKGTYKGIIPVDFAGRAVDLEEFRKLADEYGLWILEDACHAPGGYFKDAKNQRQNCGNGDFADLAIFSFHPVKHIACGEGGMITTNNATLYESILKLRTHGITKKSAEFKNSIQLAGGEISYPGWYMEMQLLGFNYRLTDFQASLGLSQLKRADAGIDRRRNIAARYNEAFTNYQIQNSNSNHILGHSGYDEGHAYHLYVLEVDDRFGLYNFLRAQNIFAQIHYFPCHLMPYYKGLGWKEGDFPHAEKYYRHCISIPMYPTLTDEEQEFVIDQILIFLTK